MAYFYLVVIFQLVSQQVAALTAQPAFQWPFLLQVQVQVQVQVQAEDLF